MPRNGSGTMTVPNSFTSGTTITSADHNENAADFAAELTNSLALDGQSVMGGQLKLANGSVGAPALAFGSDLDMGLYRIGANNLGIAIGGSKVADLAAAGMTITGDVDATILKQGTYRLVPAGAMMPYAGSSAPDGYLLCDGTSYLRATYPDLFTAIGTTYGAADGTHFNVPDLGGRVPAGKEAVATRLTSAVSGIDGATLGAAGGTQSKTLVQANLPSVTLTTTIAAEQGLHAHTEKASFTSSGSLDGISLANVQGPTDTIFQTAAATLPEMTGTTPLGGSATPVAVAQPTIITNYIIKT